MIDETTVCCIIDRCEKFKEKFIFWKTFFLSFKTANKLKFANRKKITIVALKIRQVIS